jgi:hypothetical protein
MVQADQCPICSGGDKTPEFSDWHDALDDADHIDGVVAKSTKHGSDTDKGRERLVW